MISVADKHAEQCAHVLRACYGQIVACYIIVFVSAVVERGLELKQITSQRIEIPHKTADISETVNFGSFHRRDSCLSARASADLLCLGHNPHSNDAANVLSALNGTVVDAVSFGAFYSRAFRLTRNAADVVVTVHFLSVFALNVENRRILCISDHETDVIVARYLP